MPSAQKGEIQNTMCFRKRDKKAGKPEIAKRKAENLTAKQRALAHREEVFAAAQQLYETKNYIAVVGKRGTKYYAKNDENRAVARKVQGSYSDGRKGRRKGRKTGWAHTKQYPHISHPATYKRKSAGSDEIEYITFTHSPEVDMGEKGKIQTIPLNENISPKEREKNRSEGKVNGENRSYAYPKVYEGKRSALHSETDEFDPTEEDKEKIKKLFEELPHETVPMTGGKSKFRKRKKSRRNNGTKK